MDWLQALLTVLGGAAAGGLTNRVAIWMLFHPHRPPRVLGVRLGWLQGAVPKNQERLARSIGQTVGSRLLTPEDLATALRSGDLREAFRRRLREATRDLLTGQHPPPAEWLPPDAADELERLLEEALLALRPRIADFLESEAFARGAGEALDGVARTLDRTGAPPLAPERVEALRRRADDWLAGVVGSDAFADAVSRQLERVAGELLRPGRTLEEILPPGVGTALESAVSGYLPLLLARLGRLLEDPEARARFQAAVDDLLQRFMRDLRFHQRVVARLVITEETVARVVDALQEEGAERLGELLQEPEVQQAVARNVNDAVAELLHRPATEVLGDPDDPRVERTLERTSEWLVRTARTASAREFVLERLEEAAGRAEGTTWDDLLRHVPADRWGEWIAALLRSDAGRAVAEDAAARLAGALLERPIAPQRLVGEEAAERTATILAPHLWEWVSGEVPSVVGRVPISERVEEKILQFPLPQLEGLVRSVTERELNLIVRLGYLLGAVIGAVLVAATTLVP